MLQKAGYQDGDLVSLINFLKALYFRGWKTWMLHTLYIDAVCYEVSVRLTCPLSLTSDIFMVQRLLEKKFRFFVISGVARLFLSVRPNHGEGFESPIDPGYNTF